MNTAFVLAATALGLVLTGTAIAKQTAPPFKLTSDYHVAVVYFTGKLTLQDNLDVPGHNGPAKGTLLPIKAVCANSPQYGEGFNFFYYQPKGTHQWVYGGELGKLLDALKAPRGKLDTERFKSLLFERQLSLKTLKKPIITPATPETLPSEAAKVEESQIEEITRFSNALSDFKLPLPEPTPPADEQGVSIHSLSVSGVIQTEDLQNYPFRQAPVVKSMDFSDDPPTIPSGTYSIKDIKMAEAWMAGYCAANNHTITGRGGADVFGGAVLGRWVSWNEEAKGYDIEYYIAYGCLAKSKGSIDKIKYGVSVEADLGLGGINIFSGDFWRRGEQKEAHGKPLPGEKPGSAPESFKPTFSDEVFDWLNPTLPALSYDKTSGLEQSISFNLQQPAESADPDADPKSKPMPLSMAFGGMNSFQHDFYSLNVGPKYKIDKVGTLTATFDFSELPKGGATQSTIDGKFGFSNTNSDNHGSYTYAGNFIYSAIHTPAAPTAASHVATNTNESADTAFFQKLFYLSDNMQTLYTAALQRGEKIDPHDLAPNGEVDLNSWVKAAEVTQTSNFYTDVFASVHSGLDVPTPDWFPGPVEFLRLDGSLVGGGAVGILPSSDRFNAGSNLAESAGSADVPTQPTLRSIGSNSASVYNAAFKTTGADAYGNVALTMAVPLPYLSLSVYYGSPKSDKPTTVQASNLGSDTELDNLDYAVYYSSIFSLKPLFACDAVYLGAPSGYQDRTLVSLGAGGEFSIGSLNIDALYAKTFFDSAPQPKSANLTVQVTYDIHF